jgi:hypothetical protein
MCICLEKLRVYIVRADEVDHLRPRRKLTTIFAGEEKWFMHV